MFAAQYKLIAYNECVDCAVKNERMYRWSNEEAVVDWARHEKSRQWYTGEVFIYTK
jgi:hypothetical protein